MNLSLPTLAICEKNKINPWMVELILVALNRAKPNIQNSKHISGSDLCWAIKDLCLESFGGMAKAVLNSYGFTSTHDIGKAVFSLIDHKILSRSENDTIEDFNNVYDFDEAFDIKKYVATLTL